MVLFKTSEGAGENVQRGIGLTRAEVESLARGESLRIGGSEVAEIPALVIRMGESEAEMAEAPSIEAVVCRD